MPRSNLVRHNFVVFRGLLQRNKHGGGGGGEESESESEGRE